MPSVDFARWTTTLTASYLAITAALIAILGTTVPGRVWLVALHLALSGSLLILNRARPSTGIRRVIRDWHPLMLFPLLYKEVELLAPVLGDWRLTAAIPAWESALFAGQPSLYLSERLAFVPLSEYLHFCYLSYVIVIPSVAAYWYVSGRRAAFGELLLLLSTVLLGSYLFFILLPVDSPYYLSQRLGPPLSGHFFFDLVHQVSARGGARGGAFPSAHVSGAVVLSLVAWRHQRQLAYLLVLITGSVMIATVYGRFHYVLDTIAGAALAIAVVVAYRYLSGDGPVETAPPQSGARVILQKNNREASVRSLNRLIVLAMVLAAAPALAQTPAPAASPARAPQTNWWSQAGGEAGPERIVWAAQKTPETPYTGVNKPIWHIADILKSHQGEARWEEKVILTRDFDGRYVQMAPGDKAKCVFYADDRVFGWVYSGAVKMTIDGQEPKILPKGWAFNVAPRLSYCMENVGTEPVVYYRTTPAGQVPSYPESETPTPIPGYTYIKTRITSTGGYDSFNVPFFNVTEYGDSTRTGERFLYDGHTSSNLNIGTPLKELPPSTNWGHWHANMVELWVNVYGNVCALISGVGVVHGELGDVINANEERWHRATSCPNTGKSIRMAMTPRSKEGQVHYFQAEPPAGK